MKRLLSLLSLLCIALGASARFEPVSHDGSPQDRTVVYFDLSVGGSTVDPAMFGNSYQVGAFIDGECRSVADVQYPAAGSAYLSIEVPGNYGTSGEDTGKSITFKLFDIQSSLTYALTCSQSVTYNQESYGTPSSGHVVLSVTLPTDYSLGDITVSVGRSVTLTDYVTTTPAGAALPQERSWSLGNYSNYGSVSGDVFTAGRTAQDIEYYLVLPGYDPTGAPSERTYSGVLHIVSPATAITTTQTEYSVNVGQSRELTAFLQGNYSLTPEGSSDAVVWQIADKSVVSYNANNQFAYSPVKAGTTTATPQVLNADGSVRLSGAAVTITVLQPVTGIDISDEGITANVGDTDVKSRLEQLITVSPADASNKELSWSITQPTECLRMNSDGTITAVAAGQAEVTVAATDGSRITATLYVSVEDPATAATFAANPLGVTIGSNDGTDITAQVLRNITLDGTSPRNATVTLTGVTPAGAVTGEAFIGDNESTGTFTAYRAGSATVKVTVTWQDYSAGTTSSRDYTFTLNVTEDIPLTAFTVTVTPDASRKTTGTVTLVPVPSNATFDAGSVTLAASPTVYSPWTMAEFTRTGTSPLTFSYTGLLPGSCSFVITAGDFTQGGSSGGQAQTLDIPYEVSLQAGWQWKSNAYGDAYAEDGLRTLFGSGLTEARTQRTLLYNDASWGYVGSMTGTGIAQCDMYKAKMSAAATSYLYDGKPAFGSEAVLSPGWTWVGSPYFYTRLLDNAVSASGLPDGVVIVGKTGSAETSGGIWVGDLTAVSAGEGYLMYNPTGDELSVSFGSELRMAQCDDQQPASSRSLGHGVWSYDATAFAGNMTMVCTVEGADVPGRFSVGAFVGGECRGEGVEVGGLHFVTVHADSGEPVTFRLYDVLSGEYSDVSQCVSARQRVGSVSSPFRLTPSGIALGIGSTSASGSTSARSYDLHGREAKGAGARSGRVTIVRMGDGTVRKVVR